MKDEIKEILEDYKKLAGEITEKLDNTAEYESWLIVQDYFDKLLDYITNLQTIEQQYSAILSENAELENKITNLQEENERLKREKIQKEVLDKIKEKLNQYEFISGYYDDNYDGEDTTYSHDTLKEDILKLLEGIE